MSHRSWFDDHLDRSAREVFWAVRGADVVLSKLTCVSLAQEISEAVQRREEELACSTQQSGTNSSLETSLASTHLLPQAGHTNEQPHGLLNSTITNLVVIVGFAAFAYTVKYVLRSLVEWCVSPIGACSRSTRCSHSASELMTMLWLLWWSCDVKMWQFYRGVGTKWAFFCCTVSPRGRLYKRLGNSSTQELPPGVMYYSTVYYSPFVYDKRLHHVWCHV